MFHLPIVQIIILLRIRILDLFGGEITIEINNYINGTIRK